MNYRDLLHHALGLGLALTVAACHVPAHAGHALLEISDAGAWTFQGQAVAAPELSARIAAVKPADNSLIVEILATPQTPMANVEAAVKAIRAADARVAFVGATAAR